MHCSRSKVGKSPSVFKNTRGFTLLELLVSMVIIGLILSMAVLSVGGQGRGDEVAKEARRLAALLELASQEAILKTKEFGILFTPTDYAFLEYVDDGSGVYIWKEYSDDLLKKRALPEGLEFELFLEGLPVSLEVKDEEDDDDPDDADKKKKEIKPQVMLFSSGERSPFELTIDVDDDMTLSDDELGYHLKGEMLGTLEVTKKDSL